MAKTIMEHATMCEQCRRKTYCNKPCKSADKQRQAEFNRVMLGAMGNVIQKYIQ